MTGLIFIKHGDIGTRSEGPRYYLQTSIHDAKGMFLDFELSYEKRNKHELDYHLEFYNRKMVMIKGRINDGSSQVDVLNPQVILVEEIEELISKLLPRFPLESILPGQEAT